MNIQLIEEKLNQRFPGWKLREKLGSGSFGTVYKITRENFGLFQDTSALKILEIPDEDILQDLYYEYDDEKSIKEYCEENLKYLITEIQVMSDLKGMPNIVNYEDFAIFEREDRIGWIIMIKMECLTSFKDYYKSNKDTFSDHDIVKMGINICNALSICHEKGIIHRDIKPANIFVNALGDYKIGDFGIARELEKSNTTRSKKGTIDYMAPEIYRGEKDYGMNVDIYSLGLLMYRCLNGNCMPFTTPGSKMKEKQDAFVKRMTGKKLPLPSNSKSERLSEIILKACEYDPNKRYQNVSEMKKDLEEYNLIQKEYVRQTMDQEDTGIWQEDNSNNTFIEKNETIKIVEEFPTTYEDTEFVEEVTDKKQLTEIFRENYINSQQEYRKPNLENIQSGSTKTVPVKKNEKKGRKLLLALAAVFILLLLVGSAGVYWNMNNTPKAKYEKATKAFYRRDYEKAATIFKEISDYADSAEHYKKSKYNLGQKLMNEEDYVKARACFVEIKGYKGSEGLIDKCNHILAVQKDKEPPVISGLVDSMDIPVNSMFNIKRYIALKIKIKDNVTKLMRARYKITGGVAASGVIDTSKLTRKIIYVEATDEAGNKTTKKIIIDIVPIHVTKKNRHPNIYKGDKGAISIKGFEHGYIDDWKGNGYTLTLKVENKTNKKVTAHVPSGETSINGYPLTVYCDNSDYIKPHKTGEIRNYIYDEDIKNIIGKVKQIETYIYLIDDRDNNLIEYIPITFDVNAAK